MEIKYFKTFQLNIAIGLVVCNEDNLKSEYRRLALILHPDKGGSNKDFKAMMNEYECILANLDEFKVSVEKLRIDLVDQDKRKENHSESEKVSVTPQPALIVKYLSFLIQGIKTLFRKTNSFYLKSGVVSILLLAIFVFSIALEIKEQKKMGLPNLSNQDDLRRILGIQPAQQKLDPNQDDLRRILGLPTASQQQPIDQQSVHPLSKQQIDKDFENINYIHSLVKKHGADFVINAYKTAHPETSAYIDSMVSKYNADFVVTAMLVAYLLLAPEP